MSYSPLMTAAIDPVRLSKTMSYLLRHRPDAGGLEPDEEGWVPLDDVVRAATRLMHRPVSSEDVYAMLADSEVTRFQVDGPRIRAVREKKKRRRSRSSPPDILYHATSGDLLARAGETGMLRGTSRRPLYLSTAESSAWRVAHTRFGDDPRVLYVDTTRARRHGVRFYRNRRTGLYTVERLPFSDVLNLQPNFAEQQSAGGIPIVRDADGNPKMALIKVTRRSGVTWEVAKGKLEPGETPEVAGVREVREEMGIETDLHITQYVGLIRYGFLAPGGLPRLKSVYLYLMEPPPGTVPTFTPREAEGIGEVQWFSPEDACAAVTHSSLKPIMRIARELVDPTATPASED